MSNHSGCEYWVGTDRMFSEDIIESECVGDSTWIDANVFGFQIKQYFYTEVLLLERMICYLCS